MFNYEDSLQFQSKCINFYLYNLESAFTVNEDG